MHKIKKEQTLRCLLMIHTSTSTYWLLKNYNHRKKEICISVSKTLSKELLEAVAQNLQLTKVCFTAIFNQRPGHFEVLNWLKMYGIKHK